MIGERYKWLGAEGELDGKPMMMRVRDIPMEDLADMPWQKPLVASVPFECADASGLPPAEQYEMLERFEANAIDGLERDDGGLLAFTRTTNGQVEYFLYVADIDDTVALIENCDALPPSVVFAKDEKDRWDEYRQMRSALR